MKAAPGPIPEHWLTSEREGFVSSSFGTILIVLSLLAVPGLIMALWALVFWGT